MPPCRCARPRRTSALCSVPNPPRRPWPSTGWPRRMPPLQYAHHGLCGQLFDALAAAAVPGQAAIHTLPGLDPDGLHRLAVRLTQATDGLCAALTPPKKAPATVWPWPAEMCAPDTGAECGAERPGRRQARHLSGQLRRQPGTGVRLYPPASGGLNHRFSSHQNQQGVPIP